MSMPSNNPLNRPDHFNQLYDKHVQHLKLKGLRSKTIDAYSRAIHRIGDNKKLDSHNSIKQKQLFILILYPFTPNTFDKAMG